MCFLEELERYFKCFVVISRCLIEKSRVVLLKNKGSVCLSYIKNSGVGENLIMFKFGGKLLLFLEILYFFLDFVVFFILL